MRHYPARLPKTGTGWNRTRDRATQARFRKQVLANAGHRCQAIDDHERCPVKHPLVAHHTQRGNDDPATGLALCDKHHKEIDLDAR